jgi:hypothetical protein
MLVIDDRSSGDLRCNLGTAWRFVADTVMGGNSQGNLTLDSVQGRACLRLRGGVSLANNGGFVQACVDLATDGWLDASSYAAVELDIFGNNETYNLHLRTADTQRVWQSYRASFVARSCWQTLRLPFVTLTPHRLDTPLDLRRLKRLGVVGIGRVFDVDLCIAGIRLRA